MRPATGGRANAARANPRPLPSWSVLSPSVRLIEPVPQTAGISGSQSCPGETRFRASRHPPARMMLPGKEPALRRILAWGAVDLLAAPWFCLRCCDCAGCAAAEVHWGEGLPADRSPFRAPRKRRKEGPEAEQRRLRRHSSRYRCHRSGLPGRLPPADNEPCSGYGATACASRLTRIGPAPGFTLAL